MCDSRAGVLHSAMTANRKAFGGRRHRTQALSCFQHSLAVHSTREPSACTRRLVTEFRPSRTSLDARSFGTMTISPAASLNSAAAGRIAMATSSGLLLRGGSTIPLSAALVLTGCLAAVCERQTKAGAIIGAPLLCFGVFCVLSNLHLAPATHPVYDVCWSFLLPLSLSMIILGNPVVAQRRSGSTSSNHGTRLTEKRKAASLGTIGRVGLAFGIGATGSIAGVGIAFRVAVARWAGAVSLPRETAAQIAGAVAATYIGGSVNLFAVAAAVGLMGATSVGGASVLGALAASDIFLMAVYFSGLVAAHKTPTLHRIFPAADSYDRPRRDYAKTTLEKGTFDGRCSKSGGHDGITVKSFTATAGTLVMLGLGSAVCAAGNAIASKSPLPGTATMAVTLLAVGITKFFSEISPGLHAGAARNAPALAAVLLNVFFASIGASGRWTQVVGVAPAIFAFAFLALAVHVIVIGVGAAVANRVLGVRVGIDDMIVASNANIGGPSTAATFAGLIGQDALVVPAAIWGTVGYAVATTLGVGLWTLLR